MLKCPKCGSKNTSALPGGAQVERRMGHVCNKCKHRWKE